MPDENLIFVVKVAELQTSAMENDALRSQVAALEVELRSANNDDFHQQEMDAVLHDMQQREMAWATEKQQIMQVVFRLHPGYPSKMLQNGGSTWWGATVCPCLYGALWDV